MRFLGIDPGLRITGYGCVDRASGAPVLTEAGVIRLDAGASVADRLAELDADLSAVLARLRPDVAAVESVFAHPRYPATAITMGHARGVILLNIRRAGLALIELKPNEIKKALTGHGHADKGQIQDAVRACLGLPSRPEPPDLADAIAIALCAAFREGLADTGAAVPTGASRIPRSPGR
jgi:crossover junction endodeoxyribonuclease RuvC